MNNQLMKWLEQQVSIEYSNLDRRAAYQSVINYLKSTEETTTISHPIELGRYKLSIKDECGMTSRYNGQIFSHIPSFKDDRNWFKFICPSFSLTYPEGTSDSNYSWNGPY